MVTRTRGVRSWLVKFQVPLSLSAQPSGHRYTSTAALDRPFLLMLPRDWSCMIFRVPQTLQAGEIYLGWLS